MTEWHPDEDDLLALALLTVDRDAAERLSVHLDSCASCRREFTAIDDSVQATLAAAPSIAPPAGFSGRVLAAMQLSEPAARVESLPPQGRMVWRRRTAWLMTAAVVGVLAGVGMTTAWHAFAGSTADPASLSGSGAAALTTATGDVVGTAGRTTVNARGYLVISVARGRAGMRYECFVTRADGLRSSAGSWTLTGAYGTTTASGTWLIDAPAQPVAKVELVGPNGSVWASAAF